jgi:CO/xanthine dehydrogenase Mo-binding subunit
MGEGGILPVAPAIGNAVFAATGARLQTAPLVPELVRKKIENG